jgi:hypothetical protein
MGRVGAVISVPRARLGVHEYRNRVTSKPTSSGSGIVSILAEERERLARFEGYRDELDCIMSDIRDELARSPGWRLSLSDRKQYQEILQELRNHGVRTAPEDLEKSGTGLLRQLRPVRLSLEGEIRSLRAKHGSADRGDHKRASGKAGRKPGIVLDGERVREYRGDHSQPAFARLGKISPSSVQRAEAGKAVSSAIVEGIRAAVSRCRGYKIKLKDISKKPAAEMSES